MAEELSRKKRVRAGNKASATRMLTRVADLLESTDPGGVDAAKLSQLKLSLQEKLEVVK